MEETLLCRLAREHGSDKTFLHSYTPVYHALFAEKRERVLKVLEVGVGTRTSMKHITGYKPGASLRMWRQYFPNAQIFGVDNDPEATEAANHRISVFIADQGDFDALQLLAKDYGPFDFVIDDGAHNAILQIITARAMAPSVKAGGVYSVEDTTENVPLELLWTFLEQGMVGRQVSGNGINDDGLFLAWRPL